MAINYMKSSCTVYDKAALRIIMINICQPPVISHKHALLSVMFSLVLAFKSIFILDVGYNSPAKCVYTAIEALSGIKTRQNFDFGTNSKDLVQRLQRPK